jgi:hypothetical protein
VKKAHRLLVFLLLICSPALAARKVALIIGIGDYPDDSKLLKLAADDDTTKLKAVLANNGWTVYLLNNYAELKNQPNRQNILRTLGIEETNSGLRFGASDRSFLGVHSLSSDDTLLFFYGGHGWSGPDDSTQYILPRDVQRKANGFDESTLISLSEIKTALRRTDAGSIILVADACRDNDSNPISKGNKSSSVPVWTRSAAASPTQGKVYDPESKDNPQHFVELYASYPGEVAYEMRDRNNGVFSYYLSMALSPEGSAEAESRSKNCVTLASLFEFARKSTVNYVQGQLHSKQEPQMFSDDLEWPKEFCVADYVAPTNASRPIQNQPTQEQLQAAEEARRRQLEDAEKQRKKQVEFQACINEQIQTCMQSCVQAWHHSYSDCSKKFCVYDDRDSKFGKKLGTQGLNYNSWTAECQ